MRKKIKGLTFDRHVEQGIRDLISESSNLTAGSFSSIDADDYINIEKYSEDIENVPFADGAMINSYSVQDVNRMLNYLKANSFTEKTVEYRINGFPLDSSVKSYNFTGAEFIASSDGVEIDFEVPIGFDGRRAFVKIANSRITSPSYVTKIVTAMCTDDSAVDETSRPKTFGYDIYQNKDEVKMKIKFDDPYNDYDGNLFFPVFSVIIKYWRGLV